jgi:hypothetical protein
VALFSLVLLTRFSVIVSLLMPLEGGDDLVHVRVSINEFAITREGDAQEDGLDAPADNDHTMFRKCFDGRHVSANIHRVKSCFEADKNEYYASLRAVVPESLVVSPLHVVVNLSFQNESGPHIEIEDANKSYVSADVKLSNVELTPTISQLHLFGDCLNTLKLEKAIRKCSHLRPSRSPHSGGLGNSAAWWKYAIAAVCSIQNANSRVVRRFLSSAMEEEGSSRDMRREYLVLYRKHLECGLRRIADPKRYALAKEKNEANTLPWQLSAIQTENMDRLHRLLGRDDLVTYRLMVHQGMRKAGVALESLKSSIDCSEPARFSLYQSFSSLFAVKKDQDFSSGKVQFVFFPVVLLL